MIRRPKVDRLRTGAPVEAMRCAAMVQRRDELFPDRCLRARRRGSAFCEKHQGWTQLRMGD